MTGRLSQPSLEFFYLLSHPVSASFHSHPFYEIYYFVAGKCNYLIGDKIYVLSPGDLLLMDGLTLHCPKIDPGASYIRTIVHFEPVYWQRLFEQMNMLNVLQPFQDLRNYRISFKGAEKEELEQLLTAMNRYRQSTDAVSRFRFQLVFMELLAYIYGFCRKPLEECAFPSAKEQCVQSVISYLSQNYMEDLHLQHLEDQLHLSKYYLSKIFKEVTGITIFNYLYSSRINQAKVLFLLNRDIRVTEVCYRVGFKHPAHFSKLFKQQVGCTPEQFRKASVL